MASVLSPPLPTAAVTPAPAPASSNSQHTSPSPSPSPSPGNGAIEAKSTEVAIAIPASFDSLPPDLAWKVFSYLNGSEVARLSAVSRRWKTLSEEKSLWMELFQRAFEPSLGSRFSFRGTSNPKRMYAQRIKKRAERIHTEKQQRERQEREALLNRKRARVRCCTDFHNSICLLGLPMLCVFLVVLFGAAKLDNVNSWSWGEVFIPLWILAGVVFLSIVCVCYAAARRHNSNSVCYELYSRSPRYFVAGLMSDIMDDNRRAWLHGCVMTTVAILIPILIVLKLDGVITSNWGLTLLPLWMFFALLVVMPCVGWRIEISLFLAMLGSLAFLLASAIVVVVKLDGSDIALDLAFIPLWTADCMIIVAGCSGCVAALIETRRRGWGDRMAVLMGVCAGILFFFPFMIFELLLALVDAGALTEVSWQSIFSPILLWLGMASVGGCVLAVVLYRDYQRRF